MNARRRRRGVVDLIAIELPPARAALDAAAVRDFRSHPQQRIPLNNVSNLDPRSARAS